jgi:hypothetical protein
VLQRHCVKCGRDFLIDQRSDSTHAVFVSAVSFYMLDDRVTAKWVEEFCPGQHLASDDEDRKRSVAELFVSDKSEKSR